MNNSNPLLDQAVLACFEVVMQNMPTDEFIQKAFKRSQLSESFHKVKQEQSYRKAFKTLSMLIDSQELESIKNKESSAWCRLVKDELED